MKKEKILFIYPKKQTFIKLDIDILSEKFIVIENTHNWNNKILVPFTLIKQLIFIFRHIRSVKLLISSFGGYWALLPAILGRLFNKPVFIILHGTDCASFTEINYGSLSKPILRFVLKISYRMATKLLPVSKSLVYTENTYFSKDKVIKQGYKHFFKNNKTEYTIIFNGIETDKWQIDPDNNRENNRFVTVLSTGQFVRKGGELIVEGAKKLPQFEFYFVGMDKPSFLSEVPANVRFINWLEPSGLLKEFNKSKYYLQLSIFEGFGCALCEAMSCGCIPIVSNANILPDIIGDTGYVLNNRDTESFVSLINEIANDESKSKIGINARNRIIEEFPVSRRKNDLFQVIDEC